jgi:hypothetical protein
MERLPSGALAACLEQVTDGVNQRRANVPEYLKTPGFFHTVSRGRLTEDGTV